MQNSAHQILPNLWIGNENAARDIGFLRKNKITSIVNASKRIPNFYETQPRQIGFDPHDGVGKPGSFEEIQLFQSSSE